MMQHKFEDISKHVSLKGMLLLDRIAAQAATVAAQRESACREKAFGCGDSGWIVVQVAYGRELVVQEDLDKAGIEACVPMRMGPERKRRYRVLPATSIPVFNGIVFVFCAPIADALLGIKSFEHVKNILMRGESAALIRDETINKFKEMSDRGEYDWSRPATRFLKDEKVKIVSGPFFGFEVCIEGFAGAGNGDAVVTISIFGRPTVFNIPLVMLEKV